MKVLVTGDRNWDDYKTIHRVLEDLGKRGYTIIQGGAKGADTQAWEVCLALGIDWITVDADWKKYGRAAGPKRNAEMIAMNPDIVWAFHNDLSRSKGTKNCMEQAKKAGLQVVINSTHGGAVLYHYGNKDRTLGLFDD